MRKGQQWGRLALAAPLLVAVAASGCSKGGGSGSGVSTSTATATATATAAAEKKENKIDVSFYYSDAGLGHPNGVDPSDNFLVNIIEKKANVDLKVEVPQYADFATKYNLMLSSGKLPDLVYTTVFDTTMQAARDGAFIDLKKYYDKSPAVQKVISPEMMEAAKDPKTGKYFRIPLPMDKTPQGAGVIARYDLLQKYNGGKWPESVDEWLDVMRKQKKENPNAIPMANRASGDNVFGFGGLVVFNWYGANPYGFRVTGGKIVPNVVLPEYRAAVDVMRTMYKEGLLDPEFATSDGAKFSQRVNNNEVLVYYNAADQIAPSKANKDIGREVLFAPELKKYPQELADPKYTYTGLAAPAHPTFGMYISSQAKDPDRVWRVIEAFASPELREAIFWGQEGDTYTVKDGKRIPNAEKLADPNRRWVKNLALLFGYTDGQEVTRATQDLQIADPAYIQRFYDSQKPLAQRAEKAGYTTFTGYVEPDDALKKTSEIKQEINRFTTAAIIGKISMEEFDREVKEWERKYRSLKYDPLQKYMDANKESLRKEGFKMVDW
ncbi:extracellular solute-binding protein [Paenibacillus sp. HJGM_3]|uniref:extracellular solute-binding protein n=1 Tax=Paenibacillus sp. HJGM_3 TaxID=3379816 RepID=UPI00385B92F7